MKDNKNTIEDFEVGNNVILIPVNDLDVLWIENPNCRFGVVSMVLKNKVLVECFQDNGAFEVESDPQYLVIQEKIEQEKKAWKARLAKARREAAKLERSREKYYEKKEIQGLDISIKEVHDEYHGKCYTCLDRVFETSQEAMEYAYEVQERFIKAQYSKRNKEDDEYEYDEYVEIF